MWCRSVRLVIFLVGVVLGSLGWPRDGWATLPVPPPHHFSCITHPDTRYRLYMQAIGGKKILVAEAPTCDFDYVVPKGLRLFWFSAVNASGETMRKDAGVVVDGREAQP